MARAIEALLHCVMSPALAVDRAAAPSYVGAVFKLRCLTRRSRAKLARSLQNDSEQDVELNITLVLQLVLFLFILVWLALVLLRPMLALLEERERRIDGTRKEIERLGKAGGEKTGIIEIRIEEARAQAQEERQALRDEGQKIHAALVEKARLEVQANITKARAEIETARRDAAAKLKGEAASLAQLIVTQVAGAAQDRPQQRGGQ